MMKVCKSCGEEKILDEFFSDKRASDGKYSSCKVCSNKSSRDNKRRNREKNMAYCKKWYEENKSHTSEYAKSYYEENKEKLLKYAREYREQNPEKVKETLANYEKRNKGRIASKTAKRRCDLIQRRPKWSNLKEISAYYKAANLLQKITGEKYHVDHIIPLKGKTVSGLHVPYNLQILKAKDNLSKSNKLIEGV